MTYIATAPGYLAGQANDTIGTVNGHPTPGWGNGQRWSVTATQWANTAWDSGGQLYSAGASHSAAGVGGGWWSASAAQMRANWDVEWNVSHDPQGLPHSYPGQAPNAALWSQTAAYWRAQADFYYGPSRVVNAGQSWETLYNSEVALYNAEVAAFNAEVAAYNAALAPTAVIQLQSSGISSLRTAALEQVASITFNRSGQWLVIAENDMTDTTFGLNVSGKTHLIVAGADVASTEHSLGNGTWVQPSLKVWWRGAATSGQTCAVQIAAGGAGLWDRNATGYLYAIFIPTRANPS